MAIMPVATLFREYVLGECRVFSFILGGEWPLISPCPSTAPHCPGASRGSGSSPGEDSASQNHGFNARL